MEKKSRNSLTTFCSVSPLVTTSANESAFSRAATSWSMCSAPPTICAADGQSVPNSRASRPLKRTLACACTSTKRARPGALALAFFRAILRSS